ncbi:MAG: LytTR family DNA-binding domain-containing protein [Rikenellaceae bacterium]
MRVVIIEDELAALEQLRILLTKSAEFDIEVVETIDSVEESIEFFRSPRSADVDLVFMDIHLSDGYAFTIFKHVEVNTPIIFTTAYDEYALKSFEVNCLDYILKPLSKGDIDRIFSKLRTIAQYSRLLNTERSVEKMLVMDGWRTTPLKVESVAYFYKEESRVRLCDLDGKRYLVNQTLESIEEMLSSERFVRANRQYIIAREAVRDMESYEGSRLVVNLHQTTPEPIIISRTKVTQFKRWVAKM